MAEVVINIDVTEGEKNTAREKQKGGGWQQNCKAERPKGKEMERF